MNPSFKKFLFQKTGATDIQSSEEIQSLWSGYGSIYRCKLENGDHSSVVIKHVKFPSGNDHPRGWNSNLSHERKVKSYQVEVNWYQSYSAFADGSCKIPSLIGSITEGEEVFMILEDLDAVGYEERLTNVSIDQMKVCIEWLANFHARYLNVQPEGLWEVGTYWHLDTRPDELDNLSDQPLKESAYKIDLKLKLARFQTLVHGDAKLANFCFNNNGTKTAAVDFQYIGKGVGVKDLVYFIGSCLYEEDCEQYEKELKDHYFNTLSQAIQKKNVGVNPQEVVQEWNDLFDVAWADFHRFMKGWSPGHWKINSYSEVLSQRVVSRLETSLSEDNLEELLALAKSAAQKAGEYILEKSKGAFEIMQKSAGSSAASQVLTEVDKQSENLILDIIKPSCIDYDLGLLTEEEIDNGSRLEKEFFWCIDPLDGTLPFSKGEAGYSVSIALVAKSGISFLGVVFDPVQQKMYSAVFGKGAFVNGKKLKVKKNEKPFTLVVDQSFYDSPEELISRNLVEKKQRDYEVKYNGGAVMNAIWTIQNQPACYLKQPKEKEGGGSIWDFASTQVIASEAGLNVTNANGQSLFLNNEKTCFMNGQGVKFGEV